MSDEDFGISAQTRESLITRYSSLVTFSGATFILRENAIALATFETEDQYEKQIVSALSTQLAEFRYSGFGPAGSIDGPITNFPVFSSHFSVSESTFQYAVRISRCWCRRGAKRLRSSLSEL